MSWLPRWLLWFGFFISSLLVEFEGQVAGAEGKVWSACSVLCLRVKRWWEGRIFGHKLGAEAVARQRNDRGTQKKEKQQGKKDKKGSHGAACG